MSKNTAKSVQQYDVAPPTMVHTRLTGGLLLGTDNTVWLVRRVPLEPVADAKTVQDALSASTPLLAAYEELAAMATNNMGRRSMSRSTYRQTQLLFVNLKKLYRAGPNHPLRGYLASLFPDTSVDQRVLLLAVRLKDKVGGRRGLRAALDSIGETLVSGGAPLSDFDEDKEKVSAAMARCGLTVPSSSELALADSWWGLGRQPDTVSLACDDHLHVFTDSHAVRIAGQAGVEDCSLWPDEIPGHRALTFAALEDFDFEFQRPDDSAAHWAIGLVDDNAVAISVRANVEPAKVTREELRRQRGKYIADMDERAKNNKLPRHEHQEKVATLNEVEAVYATGGSATLVDASILVAFDGEVDDIAQIAPGSAAILRTMNHRQPQALAEMMLCSSVKANPVLQDLPSQTVACSGIQSLSTVGDETGALIGFTERDHQPAYFSPTAAYSDDMAPLEVCVGQTGSGKSMVMLWRAVQFAEMGHPGVVIDPKLDSDHSDVVLAAGGQVASLDELTTSDGIFDPMRFSNSKETGIELAVSMLASVDPWGGKAARWEAELYYALSYGVEHGATCTGQALEIALHDGKANPEMVEPVLRLSDYSPLFRACVGRNPQTQALRLFNGLTLIKVGDVHLDLPEAGNIGGASLNQRTCMALVRMMVFGSAMALAGRRGVIHLDEAWVFLGAGKTEVERLGRVARSQQLQVSLYTQRISDALKAELTGYISRGLILPVEDPDEARAACAMFKLEPTPERMERITGKAKLSKGEGAGLNWNSMRALRDPEDRTKVRRGTIGIYCDLAGRAVPTEIRLPEGFLRLASTRGEDIERKQEEERQLAEAQAVPRPAPAPVLV